MITSQPSASLYMYTSSRFIRKYIFAIVFQIVRGL